MPTLRYRFADQSERMFGLLIWALSEIIDILG